MNTTFCYMGVDIGTTGIRAAVFDGKGRQIAYSYEEYGMFCESPGMAELDPDIIFQSFLKVVKDCRLKSNLPEGCIQSMGFSSQMHSFIAVDCSGTCLTRVVTWADMRSLACGEETEKQFDCGALYHLTGCRIQHPIYFISKILWLKKCYPEIYAKAYRFITIKEYILQKLCGEYLIDITDASATGCFNIHTFHWEKRVTDEILKVSPEQFGKVVPCTYLLDHIDSGYAEKMGIDPDTKVVVGSADGVMANIGCGAVDASTMTSTIGTSGALRITLDRPFLDPQQRTWCYCFDQNTWIAGGAVNNGGIVLRRIRDLFRTQFEREAKDLHIKNVYALFDSYASELPPGCDGVSFLPFITGERSPGWNADAGGFLCNLKIGCDIRHVIRSAMEGVLFNLYTVYQAIEETNGGVQRILASGGYVNSDVWLQMQSDIFNKEIYVSANGEASVLGAACVASLSSKESDSFKLPFAEMKSRKVFYPDADNHALYQQAYAKYRELYDKLIWKKNK